MFIGECFKQATDSLRSNLLRSLLTMLGIIMGVFSVITIITLGNASKNYMNSEFDKIGADIIQVSKRNNSELPAGAFGIDDVDVIERVEPDTLYVTASLYRFGAVEVNDMRDNTLLMGVQPGARFIQNLDVVYGRFINEADDGSAANVCVVSEDFAYKFFRRADVTDENITLITNKGTKARFKIAGVVSEIIDEQAKSMASAMNFDIPESIMMPLSTIQNFFGTTNIDNIQLSLAKGKDLNEVSERITDALNFKYNSEDSFQARSSEDMKEMIEKMMDVISSVLLVIAIITLLVGGIGIVNILLVSVNERIREIGVRKALGAKRSDIIAQFLTEAMLMTGISGAIGIGLGVLAGNIVFKLVDIPPVLDVSVILFPFLGSVVLGLIFGVYPAKKAADLDPIESLRYE